MFLYKKGLELGRLSGAWGCYGICAANPFCLSKKWSVGPKRFVAVLCEGGKIWLHDVFNAANFGEFE